MGEVEWVAWLFQGPPMEGGRPGLWAGCRRLDTDSADYSFGPGPEDLLRRKVCEYAQECEDFYPPGQRRRVVVRWMGEEVVGETAGVRVDGSLLLPMTGKLTEKWSEARSVDGERTMSGFHTRLTRVICWTRMQAESGQDIASIVARKELERRVGGGLFFWGVGNAPNRSTKRLAINEEEVDVVFSVMKSRPAPRDSAPSAIVVWQTYFDSFGAERSLPPHVLVTSRMETVSGIKSVHYALVCWSTSELRLGDQGSFDPSAYRNLGRQGFAGGPVGSSQVTALVVRSDDESQVSDYRINLRAKLANDYWVRLARPCVLGEAARAALREASARAGEVGSSEWLRLVSGSRTAPLATIEQQLSFF